MVCWAQIPKEYKTQQKDSIVTYYYIVQGDTIPREYIDLEEVVLLNKLSFNNKVDRRRYLILRRKTRKVYPYAKLASERLLTMTKRLQTIKKKRQASKYTKRIQKYIEQEFSEKLKKLTRTEGQILVKLIHRQTGTTAYDLVKELRTSWRAFWYNNTASLFNMSLKLPFDPINVEEDFLIEDILQRHFQTEQLEYQKSFNEFNLYELSKKWSP